MSNIGRHELLLRYVQDNQVKQVSRLLNAGISVDYKNGVALMLAVYCAGEAMMKLLLKFKPTLGLDSAITAAEATQAEKVLWLLNDYDRTRKTTPKV